MSKVNAKLVKENVRLSERVEEMTREQRNSDIEALKVEFSQRLDELEKKVAAIKKEGDRLKKEGSQQSVISDLIATKDQDENILCMKELIVVDWKPIYDNTANERAIQVFVSPHWTHLMVRQWHTEQPQCHRDDNQHSGLHRRQSALQPTGNVQLQTSASGVPVSAMATLQTLSVSQ